MKKGEQYMYQGREVTVIQFDFKRDRVEVLDTDIYHEGIAGFWVDKLELTQTI